MYYVRLTLLLFVVAGAPLVSAQTVTGAPSEQSSPPEGVFVWVTAPEVISQGDAFVLTIKIENAQISKPFAFSDVDVSGEYMDGFEIVELSPQPGDTYMGGGDLSMTFDGVLEPGETYDVRIRMRAKAAGIYIGDVDVWFMSSRSEMDFYTRVAQTRVIKK
jgi:hypothetical protein